MSKFKIDKKTIQEGHGYYVKKPKKYEDFTDDEMAKFDLNHNITKERRMKIEEIKERMKKDELKKEVEHQRQHNEHLKILENPLDVFLKRFGLSEKNTQDVKKLMQNWEVETLRKIRDVIVNKTIVETVSSGEIIPFSWIDWSEGRRQFAIEHLNAYISAKEGR